MRGGFIGYPFTHLFVLAVDQSQFEAVLGGVDGEHAGPALPVQAVHAVATDTRHVDGQVQGPDDAMVAGDGEREGGIHCQTSVLMALLISGGGRGGFCGGRIINPPRKYSIFKYN